MSRSNGSQPLPAGQVPQAGGYDINPDPRAWNPQANNPQASASPQPAAPQYQAQQRPLGQAYGQQQPVTDPYAQHGGYYQSPAQQPAYAQAPQAAARPAAQPAASPYAPQFDPYVAAPAYQPAAAQTAGAYPDLRGAAYEHPAYEQWPGQQQADPRVYDLANYGAHDQQPAQPAAYQTAAPAQRTQAGAEWGQPQQANYAQQGYDPYQQTALQGGQAAAAGQHDYGLGVAQHDQPGQDGYNSEAYAESEALDDEAPRGRRGFMIAATLAGAILVGGGLTYAYNSLLGPGAGGPPPLVKSASGPSKVKPSDPGGKQFAHADSKVLGRLNDNGTASDVDASGSKKVPTLVVKPDGTIEPPAMTEQANAAPAEAAVAPVPGLSVVSVGGGAPPAATSALAPAAAAEKAAASAVAEAKQAVQAVANAAQKPLVVAPPAALAPVTAPPAAALAPKTPVVISQAPPAAASAATSLVESAPADPAAVAAPAVKKPAPVKKVAALAAPGAAAPGAVASTAAPSTGAGYMAVVASVPASAKSRMDALTQWADMQQKYGTILQGKTMDVQEAKVADKGLYHRLLVGPPSSKDTANSICSQLKAAGHADCWVMGY